MATDNAEFKPYIPANKITTELTVTSIITGIILAIVFGAANAYLGLRVGMTISASIPAAVIAMGVTRIILKKNSILESNMVLAGLVRNDSCNCSFRWEYSIVPS